MKNIISLLAVFMLLYASSWIFNHVDPWLGIASYFITITASFYLLKYLINKTKK